MNDVSRYSTGLRRARGSSFRNSTILGLLAMPGTEAAPCAVSSLMTGPLVITIGRKKITRTIRFSDISDLQVQGRRVTFRCTGVPKQLSFVVAQVDGERLYRELLSRFPGALGGWTG